MTDPLDLEPIKARLNADYQGIGAHTDAELEQNYQDLAALVAEVEWLRAMIAGVFAGRSPEEEAADPGTAGGPFGF